MVEHSLFFKTHKVSYQELKANGLMRRVETIQSTGVSVQAIGNCGYIIVDFGCPCDAPADGVELPFFQLPDWCLPIEKLTFRTDLNNKCPGNSSLHGTGYIAIGVSSNGKVTIKQVTSGRSDLSRGFFNKRYRFGPFQIKVTESDHTEIEEITDL